MSYSLIASASNSSEGTTNLDTTTTLSPQAGDLIVAWVKWETADRTVSVAQTDAGNSLTGATKDYSTYNFGQFFYKLNATAGTGVTFRASFGSSTDYTSIIVMLFRSSGSTHALESQNTGHADSGTTPASGSINTSSGDVVVIGGYSEYTPAFPTADSEYIGGTHTGVTEVDVAGGYCYTVAWYKFFVDSAQSSITARCENLANTSWVCNIIAFKATSAGVNTDITPGTCIYEGP